MKQVAAPSSAALSAQQLAADSRSLEQLKRDAGRDPAQAIKSAARQFEAVFLQMVLKSMRDATPKSGLFDSAAGELYNGMLDQQVATTLADGGSGLASIIERQLARHLQPHAAADASAPSANGAAKVTPATRRTPPPAATGAEPMAPRHGADSQGSSRPAPVESASAAASPTQGGGGATAQSVFVNRMWDHALLAQRETGLPAKFIIGQAALESGWGSREIAGADGMRSFNLFGIKATGGWQGRTVEAVTTEYENGVAVRKVEKFRAYNNYGEAFRDWARLLTASPRYAEVLASRSDAATFANGLQRAGYATDPGYGAKLQQVIETAQALRRLG
jgi:flagellar protein FlgJ